MTLRAQNSCTLLPLSACPLYTQQCNEEITVTKLGGYHGGYHRGYHRGYPGGYQGLPGSLV